MTYNNGSCDLAREFGEGNDKIIVLFTRLEPGVTFNLRLFGRPFKSSDAFQNVRFAFGDVPAAHPLRNRLSGTIGATPFVDLGSLTLAGPRPEGDAANPLITPEFEARVNKMTICPHRGSIYRLRIGSMRATMQAMRTCTDDMVRSWGYDPAVLATALRPVAAIGDPGSWLGSDDYPSQQLYAGELDVVEFRLDVDETGKATGCATLRRAGDEAFARVTCKLMMRRARFVPALDKDGNPAKSYYINRVNWLQGL